MIEESRLVSKEVLEAIIKPFLEVRNPPYRNKAEYAQDEDLKEEGRISCRRVTCGHTYNVEVEVVVVRRNILHPSSL